jgi:1,4-alpha-glucan branching enzyme
LEKEGYHQQLLTFVSDLNTMYKSNPALWELDFSDEGFGWLDLEDRNNSIISYTRYAKDKGDHLVCILNFTLQPHQNYTIGLPKHCEYRELLCSDNNIYGGSTSRDGKIYKAMATPHAQAPFHTTIVIPPLSGIILQPIKY